MFADRQQLDSFTVPLHSPNGRHLPAGRAVQRDCHWGLKNGGNYLWSHDPMMQWDTRQSQSIFRQTNYKRAMPANWRPCLIPHWQSYCHQARTMKQSRKQWGGTSSPNFTRVKLGYRAPPSTPLHSLRQLAVGLSESNIPNGEYSTIFWLGCVLLVNAKTHSFL